MPVSVICKVCDSSFKVKPYREDSAKYCSKGCQHKSMESENVEISCDNCGNLFSVKPSRRKTARFCSNSCYNSVKSELFSGENAAGWEGGRLSSKYCDFCDEEFHFYESREDTARFCSPDCRHRELSELLSGDVQSVRNSAEYNRWRKSVISRDKECVECGESDNLHAHHIVPVEEDKSLATELSNGKTLCRECHSKKHPEIAHLIDPKS